MTSVLSFFDFSKEETQKTKNKIRLPFYRFSVYVQTNTKNGKKKNDFRFVVFPFMYEKTQKTEKQKSTSVLSFFVFCTNKHMKTGKRQMTSFLSIFPLRTKTHKNIQTEIDFRSILFRCKYNQSVKERPGYNLIFRLYFFLRFLWLFK